MDLQKRIVGILTNPKAEWPIIAVEPDDVASLYTKYILILAAIPAIGVLIAVGLFSPFAAMQVAVSTYVSTIASPIVSALVIEKLAPRFQSSGDTAQALKLVAYASTPVWIAGILWATVFLSPLILIAGLYAVYLFYLGLGPVMKTPQEQTIPFMVVAAIVIIVVSIVIQWLMALLGFGPYGSFRF